MSTELDEWRRKREESEDLDLDINCNMVHIRGHCNVILPKSPYIQSKTTVTSVKDMFNPQKNIEINEVTPEVLEVLMDLFYTNPDSQPDPKRYNVKLIVDIFKGAVLLESEHCKNLIIKVCRKILFDEGGDTDVDMLEAIWKLNETTLRETIKTRIANEPERYLQFYKALSDDDMKIIFAEKALIFRHKTEGYLLILKNYRNAYMTFIDSVYKDREDDGARDTLKEYVMFTLKDRIKTKSSKFAGHPTCLFIDNIPYAICPRDKYPRLCEKQTTCPGDILMKQLTKISTYRSGLYGGSEKINGLVFHYKDMETGMEMEANKKFDGIKTDILLDDDEYIIDVVLYQGWLIDSLLIKTNKGKCVHIPKSEEGNKLKLDFTKLNVSKYNRPDEEIEDRGKVILTNLVGYEYGRVKLEVEMVNDCRFIFAGFINDN